MDTTLAPSPPAPAHPADVVAETLERLRVTHGVVGAQLAIDRAGEVREAASGILNVELGNAATTDALFQIGSITKVYTATLVMQLVDEGLVDLDAPVVSYVTDIPSAEPERMARVTVRQLLTHSSGIEGDVFTDTGVGDDCIEKYVASLGDIGFVHEPGATTSYSNTGYVLAGRLVEVVTGQVWDDALRDRLLAPLGLTHTQTRAERMPRFAVAHGHTPADGGFDLVPNWQIPRSSGPAGIIAARARDVAAFERMHLADGVGSNGARVLSPQAAREMRREQSPAPELSRRGLGWGFGDWSDDSFGHDGSTYGQLAYSRVLPTHDLVIVLLTNGGDGQALFDDLARELLAAEVELPEPLSPPDPLPVVDTSRFEGTYRRLGTTFRLRADGDVVRGEISQDGDQSTTGAAATLQLDILPTGPDSFMTRVYGASWFAGRLLDIDGERYLHFAGRANRRVA
ncbi:serine hydrolase domain-containing protein [Microbacterium sp. NPDC096154]|uniref:serine hydrolase domain-containing protein n=1 Tax=Microbacterium sp. NPDC096154 TaxID=3155549 RepID=UPI0033233E60